MLEGRPAAAQEMLDVRRAAALVGRHPETVRRWVWSGRLAARRQAGRLLMARADIEAMASGRGTPIGLAEWADRARAARESAATDGPGRSAAELVIDDRARRPEQAGASARR